MGRFIYKRNSQFKFLGKHCVNYKKYRLNKNSGLKVAPHPKKLPTFGLMAQRIFPTEKRTHIAIEWVAFFCQRIAAHFFYLTPDTSFRALFSLPNTPREPKYIRHFLCQNTAHLQASNNILSSVYSKHLDATIASFRALFVFKRVLVRIQYSTLLKRHR